MEQPRTMLVAAAAIGRELGVARATGAALVDAGVLGPVFDDGQRRFVELTAAHALAATPLVDVDELPPAVVVKAGPAEDREPTTVDPRPWTGWAGWLDNPEERRSGISSWWPVAQANRLVGQLFVVVVSGVVVDVSRITTATEGMGGRWAFTLTEPAADDAEARAWKPNPSAPHGVRTRPIRGSIAFRNRL